MLTNETVPFFTVARRLVALSLVPLGVSLSVMCAAPLEQWHWRSPLPQGNTLYNVVFVNGGFVAVGELGTILTSSNGTNWVRRESGTAEILHDCAYGNGHYVVVGDFGAVLTSTDAITWTPAFGGTFYSLYGVTYGGNQFVAVGGGTTILTSPDGLEWTLQSTGPWDLYDVTSGDGLYVAVGGLMPSSSRPATGVVLTSTNGQEWIRRANLTRAAISVTRGGNIFALTTSGGDASAASATAWVSGNGIDWEAKPTPAWYSLAGFAYGCGKWVTAGTGSSYSRYMAEGVMYASDDFLSWSATVSNTIAVYAIAFGNGLFVPCRLDGTFLTSTDGLSWADPLPQPRLPPARDLEYLNRSFVGIARNKLTFSADGLAWTEVTLTLVGTGSNLLSLAYGNGRYVAGGEYGTVWTSTDGVNWTNPVPELSVFPYTADVLGVAYGNGVFVGVAAYRGLVLTSPDGLNWLAQDLVTNLYGSAYFQDVTFGNGRFVAVGANLIAASSDGTNWFSVAPTSYTVAVASGNGKFVAVGSGIIGVSDDGTNWISRRSVDFEGLRDVEFGSGFFVAVGGYANYAGYSSGSVEAPIWVSVDGLHWSKRHAKTARILSKVVFGDGTFIIAGEGGAILQSDPLVRLLASTRPGPELLLWGPRDCSYEIEAAETPSAAGGWTTIGTIVANASPTRFTDTNGTAANRRFYRARLLPSGKP